MLGLQDKDDDEDESSESEGEDGKDLEGIFDDVPLDNSDIQQVADDTPSSVPYWALHQTLLQLMSRSTHQL